MSRTLDRPMMSGRTTMTSSSSSSMFEKTDNSSSFTNGNRFTESQHDEETKPARRFPRRISLNEWMFSLLLLSLVLSIILSKLCVNYETSLSSQAGNRHFVPWTFAQMYDRIPNVSDLLRFDMKQISADSKGYVDANSEYIVAAANALVTFYGRYCWFLQAITCGLLITSFTWFIIYKDSSIPGVDPPSPFGSPRQKIYGYPRYSSRIQINYLLGALNGILFFIYMCL